MPTEKMSKEEFLLIYRKPRITLGAFDDNNFLNSNVSINIRQVKVSELGDYYCPWYFKNGQEITHYTEALLDQDVRAIQIKNKEEIDSNRERRNVINIGNLPKKLEPIPIATDINTRRTLILDGNKTCSILYRKYQKDNNDIILDLIEISEGNMGSMIGDFKIINRK